MNCCPYHASGGSEKLSCGGDEIAESWTATLEAEFQRLLLQRQAIATRVLSSANEQTLEMLQDHAADQDTVELWQDFIDYVEPAVLADMIEQLQDS